MAFDLIKLLADVFDPQPGEVATVACDEPHTPAEDTPAWRERRAMAQEWQAAFVALGRGRGFAANPLLTYPSTGASGAELPPAGTMAGRAVNLAEVLGGTTVAAFLTQYSATAALDGFAQRHADFRAASLPGVEKRMEHSALSADYREVARRCQVLDAILKGASSLEVSFSTGHRCFFDLRYRHPEQDNGFLPRRSDGEKVINLPSGEVYIVPYEGEQPGALSKTEGTIPARIAGELLLFQVLRNRITRVEGTGPEARRMRLFFDADPARANIAEVAFGCNQWAVVTGNVLEDEKAGFHWAYGRSDHLGGTFGVKAFASPETVVHHDVVYARGNPIQVTEATAVGHATRTRIIRNGEYIVF
ncbi:MAG: hypothetical protein V1750_04675 [Acidobacteriota bacterium]